MTLVGIDGAHELANTVLTTLRGPKRPEMHDTAPTALTDSQVVSRSQGAKWQPETSHSYACITSLPLNAMQANRIPLKVSIPAAGCADRKLVYASMHSQVAAPLSYPTPAVSNSETHNS